MKAKNLKQHIKEIELEEQEDRWGDGFWVVSGKKFYNRKEAINYASKLMEEEFRQRYLKDKKKMKEYKTIKINTFTSNEQLESMLNERAKEGFILIHETFRSEFLILERTIYTKEELIQKIELEKLRNNKQCLCKVKNEEYSTETN